MLSSRAPLLFFGGLVATLIAGCAGGSDAAEVRMLDNSFASSAIEIDVGEELRFVNAGRAPHNAIAVDGSFDTLAAAGTNQEPGDAATVALSEPGVYDYFCSLHAIQNAEGDWEGMTGTVIVGDAAQAAAVVSARSEAPDAWTGVTRAVPETYPNIQSAVDAADPGDLVLVGPGVYRESVSVTTPGLTIRGTDRNAVILDGEFTRENGVVATADGVAIENMTARNYTVNGFFWNGVIGYRGSYLTAIDDWVYGIYAFDSVDGLLEHSYASGAWDAGFYIGQCDPCNAVVTDVVAEFNGLGFSGTNASGNIYIVNSEWRYNVAGIAPNTLDSELLPPSNHVVVAGNYIHHNGEIGRAPSRTAEWSAYGNGVVLAGSRQSIVRNNLMVNNRSSGVLVVSNIDATLWPSRHNEVRDNVILGSGRADLALGGPAETGSCFSGNESSTAIPILLEWLHSCDGLNVPLVYGLAASSDSLGRIAQAKHKQNPQLAHGDAPSPALDFVQLPGGADAPVTPATDVFLSLSFDPDAVVTPALPDGVTIDGRRPVVFGIALDGGFWPVLFGVLLWWIPMATWIIGGIWVLMRVWGSERSTIAKTGWTVLVVALPVVGVLIHLAAAYSSMRRRRRVALSIGGLAAWLGAVAAALLVGGVL